MRRSGAASSTRSSTALAKISLIFLLVACLLPRSLRAEDGDDEPSEADVSEPALTSGHPERLATLLASTEDLYDFAPLAELDPRYKTLLDAFRHRQYAAVVRQAAEVATTARQSQVSQAALHLLALAHEAQRNWPEAERAWQRLAQAGPFAQRARQHLADLALRRKDVEEALAQLALRGPVQIQAALPLRWQQRAYPTMASQSAVGVGDAAVALRWTALEDKMTGVLAGEPGMYLPFLDLAAGVKMPTGRATEDGNPDKAGADVTGDGAWQVTATVRVLKYVTRQHAFGIGADYSHQFDRSVPDGNGGKSKFAKGDSLEVRGTWLQLHGMYWSWGAFASYLMGADAHQAGVAVPDSAVRHFRVGANVTRVLSLPAWETTLGVALDPWWQDGARNVPYVGPSVSLSLRRNFL